MWAGAAAESAAQLRPPFEQENLEDIAVELKDGDGLYLGYSGIMDAVNDTAL